MSDELIVAKGNNLEPAGFWIRSGAYVIDLYICAIPAVLFFATGLWRFNKVLPFVILLVTIIYQTYMLAACHGQTFGKRAAGIAVIRNDGSGLSYARAFLRWFGTAVSGLLLGLDYWIIPFTTQKRALHDFIADTRVIRRVPIGAGRKVLVIGAFLMIPFGVTLAGFSAGVMSEFLAHLHSRNKALVTNSQVQKTSSNGDQPENETKLRSIYQLKMKQFPQQALDSQYARSCLKRNLELFPMLNTHGGVLGMTFSCTCAADKLLHGANFSNIEAELKQGKKPGEVSEFEEVMQASLACAEENEKIANDAEKEMDGSK